MWEKMLKRQLGCQNVGYAIIMLKSFLHFSISLLFLLTTPTYFSTLHNLWANQPIGVN